eukprot:9035926-Lingulodinium_polyedra.AAC.1
MRKKLIDNIDEYKNDYQKFEESLYEELEMRRTDEERKKGGRLGVLGKGAEEERDEEQEHDDDGSFWAEVWTESQGWICAFPPKTAGG